MSDHRRIALRPDRYAFLWLFTALIFGAVGTGRWTVPAAAWLASVFLLRFFRLRRPLSAVLFAAPVLALIFVVGWRGLFPYGGDAGFLAMAVAVGLFGTLPFLADRLLYHRFGAVAGTLVFPAVVTALEFLGTLGSDFAGSWGATAYTQFGNLPLTQLASVTGLWGITFLIAWFASVANHAWERDFALRSARGPVLAFAMVLTTVLLLGALRLTATDDVPLVRVAAIAEPTLTGPESVWPSGELAGRYFAGGSLSDQEWAEVESRMARAQDRLFERTLAEARAGARLLFWAEANAPVRERDEAALLARGGALARAEGVYLGMSLLVLPDDLSRKIQNKVVLVGPDGTPAGEYHKSVPVPGFEAAVLERGDGRPAVWDTPYGRIAAVVCFDLDFPRLIRRAGRDGVDILFGPSNDWPAIADLHMQMATFRAIEQGVSLVRPTTGGYSVATDPYGRILARMDSRHAAEPGMSAFVPARGRPTPYTTTGDLFAWLCVAGALLLIGAGVRRSRRERRAPTPAVPSEATAPLAAESTRNE